MSDTLSGKKRTVKNNSTERNPRPTRPQPSLAATVRLMAGAGQPMTNPRPTHSHSSLREVCGPNAAGYGPRSCRDRSSADKQVRKNVAKAGPERQEHSPGVAKLQAWLGMRSGVSPMLRKLCTSGDEALILNQLVCYWFARDDKNRIRARIKKAGYRWVAKSCKEWSDELGMTPKQARRCIEALVEKGLIEVRTWRFKGKNTNHVRLLTSQIARATSGPKDQRPYRRSDRGPMLTSKEKRKRDEEREIDRMTQYMEELGRESR